MIIINKRRISFIILMLTVSVISFSIISKGENTIQTVSLPVSDKIIVLDAGHGSPDEGAESASGVTEASLNLHSLVSAMMKFSQKQFLKTRL